MPKPLVVLDALVRHPLEIGLRDPLFRHGEQHGALFGNVLPKDINEPADELAEAAFHVLRSGNTERRRPR